MNQEAGTIQRWPFRLAELPVPGFHLAQGMRLHGRCLPIPGSAAGGACPPCSGGAPCRAQGQRSGQGCAARGFRMLMVAPDYASAVRLATAALAVGCELRLLPDADAALAIAQSDWHFDALVVELGKDEAPVARLVHHLWAVRPWLPVLVARARPAPAGPGLAWLEEGPGMELPAEATAQALATTALWLACRAFRKACMGTGMAHQQQPAKAAPGGGETWATAPGQAEVALSC